MNLLGMKRKLLPYGMPLGGFGGAAGSAMGAISKSLPTNSNTNSPAPSGGKSSGAGLGGYGAAPAFGGQQQPQGGFNQLNDVNSMFRGMPISGTDSKLFDGQQPTAQTQPSFGLGGGGASGPNMGAGKSSGLGQGGYGMAPAFGGDRGQPGFGGDPRFSGPMGGQQPGAPMSFDEFSKNDMFQDAGPGRDTRLQRNYQSYLDRQQSGLTGSYGQGQANPMDAQRAMQGGMGRFGGMGGRFQQPQFNQFQQQQTPESLYAANMGMPPPQQFNQQRFNPFQQQFGGFQQPQQQSQDMRGLAELLSLLRGRF